MGTHRLSDDHGGRSNTGKYLKKSTRRAQQKQRWWEPVIIYYGQYGPKGFWKDKGIYLGEISFTKITKAPWRYKVMVKSHAARNQYILK